jgi:multiple sugar transport system permease protein
LRTWTTGAAVLKTRDLCGKTGGGERAVIFSGRRAVPYLLWAPAFIYYAVFWLTPVVGGIMEVFSSLEGGFTLTENFSLMAESDLFFQSVSNTAVFAAVSVTVQYTIALVLAVFLNIKFKFSNLLMFIAMIPMAITPTAAAILWKTGLFKDGWINSILLGLHIVKEPVLFMNAENFSALLIIILIDTWTVTPSVMIILSAGLQGISKDLREAAYSFGADKWQVFKDITLPILRPSIMTSIILRLISAVQVWAIAVMVLGHGRVPFLVERIAFYEDIIPGVPSSGKIAFTLSFTTTVIVFLVTMLYYRLNRQGTYLELLNG